MIRTILVPLAEGIEHDPVLDTALWLGRQLDSHIQAVFIQPDPAAIRPFIPDTVAIAIGGEAGLERELRQAEVDQQQYFATWCAGNEVATSVAPGFTGSSASWSASVGDIETIVTRLGRVSDLIVVQRPTSSALAAQRCFDAAVFGSGRPTVVVSDGRWGGMTDHLMIAWNGSIEASRAVAAAMPLLHRAKRVSIFTALEYGAEAGDLGDLAEALRWHGIHTPEVIFPGEGESTGPALVAAIDRQQSTMLVMGAYTHSRLRQRFLGGVTEHLLARTEVPLLMCH